MPRASKNAKASLSTVQKRHFAKFRAKLQNCRPSSPGIDFSLFKNAKCTEARSYHEIGRHRAKTAPREHWKDPQSHRTLDEPGSFAPQIQDVDSFKTLHRKRRISPSSLIEVGGYNEQEHQPSTRPPLPKQPSLRPSSASTSTRAVSDVHESGNKAPRVSVTDVLEAKRQELLCTRDWVGLNITKPVHMEFVGVRDRDLIGKRRSLEGRGRFERDDGNGRRRKTANGLNKSSTSLQVPESDTSPADVSVRIGSKRLRSRPKDLNKLFSHSLDHESLISEEMLLAQEACDKSELCDRFRDHVYSREFSSPQPTINRQTFLCHSPANIQGSWISHSRFNLQPAASESEGQVGILPSQNPAGARHSLSTAEIDSTPRISHNPIADESADLGLALDHLPEHFYRNPDFSSTAPIGTSKASSNTSNAGATLLATPASAKRRRTDLRDPSVCIESEIKRCTRDQSPLGDAVVLEPDEKQKTIESKSNEKGVFTIQELRADISREQPSACMVQIEKSDGIVLEGEHKSLEQATESEELLRESCQDEEKLWRDFVFGFDHGNGEDTFISPESPILLTQDGGGISSMIAEFDFEETSVPKTESLSIGSSVIVEASQHSSPSHSASFDLPFALPQASDSSMGTQKLISDPSSEDPLAWTPRRLVTPKVVFRKPSKYCGRQDETPTLIRLGHNLRGDLVNKSRGSGIGKSRKGKEQKIDNTSILEDEIEDD